MSVWKMMVAAAGTALLLTACGGSGGGDGGSSCTPTGGSTGGTASTTVKVVSDPNTVGKYDPSSISVKAGDTVEWDFKDDSAQHSVTEDNGTFDSCLQNAGAKFSVSFSKAGDYKYHCQIHAQMVGEVKVS